MKKMIRMVSVLFLLVLLFGLTACRSEEEPDPAAEQAHHAPASDLVGTWKGTGDEISTLTLGADGSYNDDAGELYIIGTYTVDPVEGTMTVYESEYGMVFTYDYECSGNSLTIQTRGGLPRTFARQ